MKQRLLYLLSVSIALAASLITSTQAANIVTFREGVNGYAGTQDTFISIGTPTTDNGSDTTIEMDTADDGVGGEFLLIRFDNIFGSGANQVPSKAKILFASLTIQITNTGADPLMHRMLVPWQESSTWASLTDGIATDDVEAALTEDQLFEGGTAGKVIIPLALGTLQAWSDGTKPNHGWVFAPAGTDGTDVSSSEHATLDQRPLLTIVWGTVDEPFVTSVNPLGGATQVPVDANITITISDGATQLNPSSVRMLVNGASVTPVLDKPADTIVTTITYDSPKDFPDNSLVTLRLIYADNASPAHLSTNDFTFTTRANTAPLVKIDDVQIWKFDRSGTDMGTAWKEKVFNDSAWEQGMAILADESGTMAEPIRTPFSRINDAGEPVATFYFRTHFNYTGPLGGNLFLRYIVDDGAIFYLNGTPIHWAGYAVGATPNFADATAGGPATEGAYVGPITIPGGALVNGDNVFAVEVHQSSLTSSDVVMGAELLVATTGLAATSIVSARPATNAVNVAVTTPIGFTLADGTRQVQTNTVQLSVNGQPVVPTVSKPAGSRFTEITYSPAGGFAFNTPVAVRLVFGDNDTPPTLTTNSFSFTTAPNVASSLPLVRIDDVQIWRYDRSGTDMGTAWKEKVFNDTAWEQGMAIIADDTATMAEPIRTPISRLNDAGTYVATFYFRTHFNYTGPLGGDLFLRYIVDDGAIFYLNGTPIHWAGYAVGATPAFNNTGASGPATEGAYVGPVVIPGSALVSGDNVLAVEVHQSGGSSSDMAFGAELLVSTVPAKPPAAKFTAASRAGANINLAWSGTGTLQSATAVTGPWIDVANATSPFSEAVAGTAKFYRFKP
jgi:hypothetical protein